MTDRERARTDRAFARARRAAYGADEFVGQEGFMRASEILELAVRAGVGPGAAVLDLCCGVAGPGRLITRDLGCRYLGVDVSPAAVDLARERSAGLGCRFEVSRVPPVPAGRFDVVLLLETMLAFPDKEPLLHAVRSALTGDGRFAFTLEEGDPLTDAERERMPAADTVWPVPLAELVSCLRRAGMRVRRQQDCSRSHRAVAESLVAAMAADAARITAQVGVAALDDLLAAHRLWVEWLRAGRVRKFAIVAEPEPRS